MSPIVRHGRPAKHHHRAKKSGLLLKLPVTRNDLDRAIVTLCDSGPWTADYLETQIEHVSPVYLRRRLRVLRRNEIVAYDPRSRTWRAV